MLTEVQANPAWGSGDPLSMHLGDGSDDDVIQIHNITGLDPVKASISTSEYGDTPGESLTQTHTPKRNIVLTLGPNPDWVTWNITQLRQYLYTFFIPERPTKLTFISDELPTVEIEGYVESVEANLFSKDPEIQVSIICPQPYFSAADATVVTGVTTDSSSPTTVTYTGNVPAWLVLKVTDGGAGSPTDITVTIAGDIISYARINQAIVDADNYVELSSVPLSKYFREVFVAGGFLNILGKVSDDGAHSLWPVLAPGDNDLDVITDSAGHDWELTYYARFGGL